MNGGRTDIGQALHFAQFSVLNRASKRNASAVTRMVVVVTDGDSTDGVPDAGMQIYCIYKLILIKRSLNVFLTFCSKALLLISNSNLENIFTDLSRICLEN